MNYVPRLWNAVLTLGFVAVAGPFVEAQLGPPSVPPENPITTEKLVLGKMLFWDEQLSSDNTVACGTCHRPGFGGTDPRFQRTAGTDGILGNDDDRFGSPGVIASAHDLTFADHGADAFETQATTRLSPPFLMAAYAPELFWDGRASTTFRDPESGRVAIVAGGALESQSLGPILSSVEMATAGRTWFDVRRKLEAVRPLALADQLPLDLQIALRSHPTYPALFAAAYGDRTITPSRIAFAIATYERSLVPNQTPWDRFAAGDTSALTQAQQNGLGIFQQANCRACHPPAGFTDHKFTNIGVRPAPEDLGRMVITQNPADRGAFKNPTLRNVGLRSRFFHDGSAASIREVLEFYDRGGDFADNRDNRVVPLNLTDIELDELEDFLVNGLTDPRVAMESGPFARPRLASERNATPTTYGFGSVGSGGIRPQPILSTPALPGALFRIGVHSALGGARAILVLDVAPATDMFGPIPLYVGLVAPRFERLRLAGQGPGNGYGTWIATLPDRPSLAGEEGFAQWFVEDPSAAGGFAVTSGIRWVIQ